MTLKKSALTLFFVALALPALAEMTLTRAQFARDVIGREPEGVAEAFPATVGKVVFFNQVSGVVKPTEIKHVWIYGNQVEMEVKLPVDMEGWRVWSVKKIAPDQKGLWHVETLDHSGNVLHSATFTIQE